MHYLSFMGTLFSRKIIKVTHSVIFFADLTLAKFCQQNFEQNT